MSESTLDKAKSREAVLNMTLKDVLNELKDGLDTAEKYGSSCSIVNFANEINAIEGMIDNFMAVDEQTEGLISERYAKNLSYETATTKQPTHNTNLRKDEG